MSHDERDDKHYYRHTERDSYDEERERFDLRREEDAHHQRASISDHYARQEREREEPAPRAPSGPSEPPALGMRALRVALLAGALCVALAVGVGGLDVRLPSAGTIPEGWRTAAAVIALVLYAILMKEVIGGLYHARPEVAKALGRLALGALAGLAAGAAFVLLTAAGMEVAVFEAASGLLRSLQQTLPG